AGEAVRWPHGAAGRHDCGLGEEVPRPKGANPSSAIAMSTATPPGADHTFNTTIAVETRIVALKLIITASATVSIARMVTLATSPSANSSSALFRIASLVVPFALGDRCGAGFSRRVPVILLMLVTSPFPVWSTRRGPPMRPARRSRLPVTTSVHHHLADLGDGSPDLRPLRISRPRRGS